MKELESVDMLLSLIDVEKSREGIEDIVSRVDAQNITCITFDECNDSIMVSINLYECVPSRHYLRDGVWGEYKTWHSIVLISPVIMGASGIIVDDAMNTLLDKLRMILL